MSKFYLFVILLLAVINVVGNGISYNVKQTNWRWRNNDGAEAAATWKAPPQTQIGYGSIFDVLRLRLEIVNTSTSTDCGSAAPCNRYAYTLPMLDRLQYSTAPASGQWFNIGYNANAAFVMARNGAGITQNDTTTAQLTGNTQPFSPGKTMVTDTVLRNISIRPNSRSEFEWTIVGTPNMLPNTTYYFRQYRVLVYTASSYLTYPVLSTSSEAALPVRLDYFGASNDGLRVKLDWSTSWEKNNDYFSILRSSDGQAWQSIAIVKGNSGSTTLIRYTFYDDAPPGNGTVYYRLQQFDKDGRSTLSEVKSLQRFSNAKNTVTVLPNPARSGINFRLEKSTGRNVHVTLKDYSGKTLHEEYFDVVQPLVLKTLNLKKKPSAGIYILKVQAEGLTETIRVVVQ